MAEQKKAEPKKQSKWDIKEEIYIPKIPGVKDQPDQSVFINGKFFQIQRGVKVEVPRPVADVIRRSLELEQKAEDFYLGR